MRGSLPRVSTFATVVAAIGVEKDLGSILCMRNESSKSYHRREAAMNSRIAYCRVCYQEGYRVLGLGLVIWLSVSGSLPFISHAGGHVAGSGNRQKCLNGTNASASKISASE
jgi:hypothetical protein